MKTRNIAVFAALALMLTACGKPADTSAPVTTAEMTETQSDNTEKAEKEETEKTETDAPAETEAEEDLEYEYDAALGGAVITAYKGEAMNTIIPISMSCTICLNNENESPPDARQEEILYI